MLSNLIFVGIMCCIIFLDNFPVNGKVTTEQWIAMCKTQSSYSLTNQKSLTLDLYYDALKGLDPDTTFVKAMCKGMENCKNVTFNFHVGVMVQAGKKVPIECIYKDNMKSDCTDAIEQACASKLVPNFAEFVCCVTNGAKAAKEIHFTSNRQCFSYVSVDYWTSHNFAKTFITPVIDTSLACYNSTTKHLMECVSDQDKNQSTKFDQCMKMDGSSNIRPVDILLDNASKAKSIVTHAIPKLLFNGKEDGCARYIFYDDQVKVICAMLGTKTC